MRTIIAHGHIFKNAGTTFDWSLKRNFGIDFIDHRDDKSMRRGGADYLDDFLMKNENIKAISSHHLCLPLPKNVGYNILPCYILRNPILRIKSVYDFEVQQKSDSLGAKTAKNLNFLEYCIWRMKEDIPPTIRNYQTLYLSGVKKRPLNYFDYSNAVQYVKKTNLVGLVERYDESMVLFEEEFRKKGISLDLSHKKQNVIYDGNLPISNRIDLILEELSEKANFIIAKNLYDLRLYAKMCILFEERIKKIPEFYLKLKSYRDRCSML